MKIKPFFLFIIIAIICLIPFFTQFPPTQPEKARRILEDRGFKDIHITGYSWINRCGEDDVFRTKFKAVSSQTKRPVRGVVCSGWFKGSTIRTY